MVMNNKKMKVSDISKNVPFTLSLPFHLVSWSLLALGIFLCAMHLLVVSGLLPNNDLFFITTVRKDFTVLDPVTAIRWKLYIPQYLKGGLFVYLGLIGIASCMLAVKYITLKLVLRKYGASQ